MDTLSIVHRSLKSNLKKERAAEANYAQQFAGYELLI